MQPDPPTATADLPPPTNVAPPPPHCANCGADLSGRYCGDCGQPNHPLRQPLGRFLKESFVEFFGIDGRLWPTLNRLLFRPGRLTTSYLTGHRVRYLRPLRLYLSASLLFFFLLSLIDPIGQVVPDDFENPSDSTLTVAAYLPILATAMDDNLAAIDQQVARVDSLRAAFQADSIAFAALVRTDDPTAYEAAEEALDDLEDDLDDANDRLWRTRRSVTRANRRTRWKQSQIASSPPDSLVRIADLDRAATLLFDEPPEVNINLPNWVPQSQAVRQVRMARTGEEMQAAWMAFARDVLRRLPTVMFLMLPVFAFLLKLIYVRRDWFYSEHLIFGLHTHAFAYAMFAAALVPVWVFGGVWWAELTANLFILSIPVYFYIAQKRVYGQGWIKTFIKACVLGWLYTLVLTGGFLLALMLAAAL